MQTLIKNKFKKHATKTTNINNLKQKQNEKSKNCKRSEPARF